MSAQLAFTFEPAPRAHREGALHSFHVRSHVTVPEALEGESRAAAQEGIILAFFREHPGRWTPSEVANNVNRGRPRPWPLTSVRRAITNLAAEPREELVHHPKDRRPGPFGSLESTWGLA